MIKKKWCLVITVFLFLIQLMITSAVADEKLVLEFFYSETCHSCFEKEEIIDENFIQNTSYQDVLLVVKKNIDNESVRQEWIKKHNYFIFPFVVIKNETIETSPIPENNITVQNLKKIIDELLFRMIIHPVITHEGKIVIEYYYSVDDTDSPGQLEKINETQLEHPKWVLCVLKNIDLNETYHEEYDVIVNTSETIHTHPFMLIKNLNGTTLKEIKNKDIDRYLEYLENSLTVFTQGVKQNETSRNIIHTPFGSFDLSELSLPVLTIIIGGVDSINPCAIFILFILLGLLTYAESRRRILLIGGIFIFFSGLWYYLFMFVLSTTFNAFQAGTIAVVIGVIAVVFGVLNIKDFFFFKKGISIGIPDDKKPGMYKQMRKIVKAKNVTTAIYGTVALAATVNLFEFLCSLQWAGFYTGQLRVAKIPLMQQYLYILFYNIIYVIPLIIIVVIFAFTLGRWKLSEWQGRILRFFSGMMILVFGIIFLYDYTLLSDVKIPIIILVFSIISTYIVALIIKKKLFHKKIFRKKSDG